MESGEINWELCILCQESTPEPLRSTEKVSNKCITPSIIDSLFRKYHQKCKSKYNTRMYNRAKKEFNEFIDVSPAETETSQHRHTLRDDGEKLFLGELKCIFCTKYDDLCNLMAAGTYHAS